MDARDRDGDPVVVAVGGHYRSAAVTREDLLLHIVKVCLEVKRGVSALTRSCHH